MADLLDADGLRQGLEILEGWDGNLGGIEKTWTFTDFDEAVRFVVRVADVVRVPNHHPDVDIRWNKVTLKLVSHSAGGLTQADIDTAALIDRETEGF
ncbi:MAG TPA: 4a-hydroxytetrahydrobiopterin dehydratase [Egibacteraceae bacterium]|nr:4a-hydroxytetrahydrobiopterin dehydratase [Egibacteraceae bacterium]